MNGTVIFIYRFVHTAVTLIGISKPGKLFLNPYLRAAVINNNHTPITGRPSKWGHSSKDYLTQRERYNLQIVIN